MTEMFSVVIQAGGQSTRMGEDKALLRFCGTTMVEYILAQIQGWGNQHLIISNRPESYPDLGIKIYKDVLPGIGALGGIYSALMHAKYEKVVLLACDMPFINLDFMNLLLKDATENQVVIPKIDERFAEPFRAVFAKSALPAIKQAIDREERRVISFFEDVRVKYVGQDIINLYDPNGTQFINVNTPEDVIAAELMAGCESTGD